MPVDLYLDFDFDYKNDIVQKKDMDSNERLLEDIREVAKRLEIAKAKFEFESDGDLIEATIYEMESLNARYRYLIKLAKSRQMKSEDIGSLYTLTAS